MVAEQSDLSKALGKAEEIVLEGKTYQLAPLNADIQAAFEIWLKRNTLAEIQQAKGDLGPEDYAERLDRHFQQRGSGQFSFLSKLATESYYKTFVGKRYLAYLRLKYFDPSITEEDANDLFARHIQELQKLQDSMDRDPNSPAPEPTQTPGTT